MKGNGSELSEGPLLSQMVRGQEFSSSFSDDESRISPREVVIRFSSDTVIKSALRSNHIQRPCNRVTFSGDLEDIIYIKPVIDVVRVYKSKINELQCIIARLNIITKTIQSIISRTTDHNLQEILRINCDEIAVLKRNISVFISRLSREMKPANFLSRFLCVSKREIAGFHNKFGYEYQIINQNYINLLMKIKNYLDLFQVRSRRIFKAFPKNIRKQRNEIETMFDGLRDRSRFFSANRQNDRVIINVDMQHGKIIETSKIYNGNRLVSTNIIVGCSG